MLLGEVGAQGSGYLDSNTAGISSARYPALQALVWFDEGGSTLAGHPSAAAGLRRLLGSA